MGDLQPGADLPQFDASKVYLVKGSSLNAMTAKIKAYRPRVVDGGGLKITSQGADGTFLSATILELSVCIGGNVATKKFLVAD